MPTRDSPTRRQPRPSSSFVSTTVNRLADDRALALFPPTFADVPQDVSVRDILETEPPPLPADDRPDSRTNRSSAVDSSRGGSASHADFSDGTLRDDIHLRDRREEEERFLPTQAAIASTPRRGGPRILSGRLPTASDPEIVEPSITPVHMGGFDCTAGGTRCTRRRRRGVGRRRRCARARRIHRVRRGLARGVGSPCVVGSVPSVDPNIPVLLHPRLLRV